MLTSRCLINLHIWHSKACVCARTHGSKQACMCRIQTYPHISPLWVVLTRDNITLHDKEANLGQRQYKLTTYMEGASTQHLWHRKRPKQDGNIWQQHIEWLYSLTLTTELRLPWITQLCQSLYINLFLYANIGHCSRSPEGQTSYFLHWTKGWIHSLYGCTLDRCEHLLWFEGLRAVLWLRTVGALHRGLFSEGAGDCFAVVYADPNSWLRSLLIKGTALENSRVWEEYCTHNSVGLNVWSAGKYVHIHKHKEGLPSRLFSYKSPPTARKSSVNHGVSDNDGTNRACKVCPLPSHMHAPLAPSTACQAALPPAEREDEQGRVINPQDLHKRSQCICFWGWVGCFSTNTEGCQERNGRSLPH